MACVEAHGKHGVPTGLLEHLVLSAPVVVLPVEQGMHLGSLLIALGLTWMNP